MILTPEQLAFARQNFGNITKGLGLAALEAAVERVIAEGPAAEAAHLAAKAAHDEALDRLSVIQRGIGEREAELIATATSAEAATKEAIAHLKTQIKCAEDDAAKRHEAEVAELQDAVKEREAELQAAVVAEKDPEDPTKDRYTNQNARNAAFTAAKKTDEKLAELKAAHKKAKAEKPADSEQIAHVRQHVAKLEAERAPVGTSAERASFLAAAASTDEELVALKAALDPAKHAVAETRSAEAAARVALNAITREYHLRTAQLYLKAGVVSNLGGFEIPIPTPVNTPAPAPTSAPAQ